jgi:hypothetical protein
MDEPASRHSPTPLHFLWAAIAAIGFLLVVMLILPPDASPPQPEPPYRQAAGPAARQRVVIFLIDTSDYFDAHGAYVQSVIRMYCGACDVRQVNLHGNISIPSLLEALQHVWEVQGTFAPTTTTLVNLSLGTYAYDRPLQKMIRTLLDQGLIVIASAGNDNATKPFYPAAFDGVLSICSTTRYSKVKAPYSNFGAWVTLCAPGLQYVTRPLQPGGLASGTSFASPMVAGVLGQLLLDAPCTPARVGVQALLRTADPIAGHPHQLGAGLINPRAAAHYLRTLYSCEPAGGMAQRLLARFQRLGSGLIRAVGLIAYALVSIFALPFLLAFGLDRLERRSERRQRDAIQMAYSGTSRYRRERLLAIKSRWLRKGKTRRREAAEVYALLHALHVSGEPCWWCDRPAGNPACEPPTLGPHQGCSRCGVRLLKRGTAAGRAWGA